MALPNCLGCGKFVGKTNGTVLRYYDSYQEMAEYEPWCWPCLRNEKPWMFGEGWSWPDAMQS